MTIERKSLKVGDVIVISYPGPRQIWWTETEESLYAIHDKKVLVVEKLDRGESGPIHDRYAGYTEFVVRRCDSLGRLLTAKTRFSISSGGRHSVEPDAIRVVGHMRQVWVPE